MTPEQRDQAIRNLLIWQSPKEFILLVVLVSYLKKPYDAAYELIEFFAGLARVSRYAKYRGFKACAVDIRYDCGAAHDVNGASGFAFLECSWL